MNIMEYSTKNDFILQFKALFNKEGEFQDYILIKNSNNFFDISNIKPENVMGKKMSEIVIANEDHILGIKELYYHMVPKANRKFDRYIDELDRWYSITIYSDDRDYLILFYTDISEIKDCNQKAMN